MIGEQLPQRLALALRPEIPDGVDDRGRGEMDHALLGPQPAQLRVRRRGYARTAHVADDLSERAPDHERLERTDGGDADLVSAPVVNVSP